MEMLAGIALGLTSFAALLGFMALTVKVFKLNS